MADDQVEDVQLPGKDVLEHVIDVHCHPTDEIDISDAQMDDLAIRICTMATRSDDQTRVSELCKRYTQKVIPCFGFHPWFYHEISLVDPVPSKDEHYRALFLSGPVNTKKEEQLRDLMNVLLEPRALKDILEDVKSNLIAHPMAMLGEVGLDRSFRIANPPYPSPSPKKLTPFSTPIAHQISILEAQLNLAVQLKRNVSIHSVASQQVTIDLLQRMKEKHGADWRAISIDMHSCGLSSEGWRELEKDHSNIFLSLSVGINARSENHVHLIQNCTEDRLLAESDWNKVRHCTPQTWKMLEIISNIRGWPLETKWDDEAPPEAEWGVVRRLERNWRRFEKGDHPEAPLRKSRRLRKQHETYPSDESEVE